MVNVYLADGFEEIEALTVVDILRRGNCEVKMVSIMPRLYVMGAHGIEVKADFLFDEAKNEEAEMIVLPGGIPGAPNLEKHKGLHDIIEKFARDGKKISAICAAPMILGHMGILNGRKATIYPGMEKEIEGAIYNKERVAIDENIITAEGPERAVDFALSILESLKGKEIMREVASGFLK